MALSVRPPSPPQCTQLSVSDVEFLIWFRGGPSHSILAIEMWRGGSGKALRQYLRSVFRPALSPIHTALPGIEDEMTDLDVPQCCLAAQTTKIKFIPSLVSDQRPIAEIFCDVAKCFCNGLQMVHPEVGKVVSNPPIGPVCVLVQPTWQVGSEKANRPPSCEGEWKGGHRNNLRGRRRK